MTAILGLIDGENIYMGCDSCSNVGWEQYTLPSAKVYRLPLAKMLVGVAGTWRDSQIIRYHADMEMPEGDGEEVLVKYFVPALRETFKTHGSNVGGDGQAKPFDSELLIGFRGCLYFIDAGYGVIPCGESYRTIGNGGVISLGAIAAIELLSNTDTVAPETRIRQALAIAEQFTSGVRSPFLVERLCVLETT
jgi:ATP-dependent protease HslVU (ClpYQ) peptidase subunit